MNRFIPALAISLLASAAAQAAAPAPSAALNRSFAEYIGAGPIGQNGLQDGSTVYWLREGSGTWMGQAVDSWFLMWDPVQGAKAHGSISFSRPVLAVFDDRAELLASAGFQAAGVTYMNPAAVGLERPANCGNSPINRADCWWLGNGDQTLSINWNASSPGDSMRVLTSAVPEPESYALMLAGLAALGFLARRSRQA
jgi:hypothetical protein